MVALPWSAAFSPELSAPEDEARNAPQTVWGGKGSNDTGWVDMIATGADLANGTYAYSDLYLDFAPEPRYRISLSRSLSTVQMAIGPLNRS
jgi:hypothetical protein